jgi:hypothetical protein
VVVRLSSCVEPVGSWVCLSRLQRWVRRRDLVAGSSLAEGVGSQVHHRCQGGSRCFAALGSTGTECATAAGGAR